MGIIDKAVQRYLDKKKTENPYEYNTIITPDRMEALRDRFTRNMLINSVWYGGNDLALKQLYERDLKAFKIGNLTSEELNYFWAQPTSGTNIRKVHSGIPQLISEKMVDLITSNGYEYKVYEDNDDADKEKEEDEENQERLAMILEDNMFEVLLQEAIETESWSGGVAIKLSTNTALPYPIIEIIQPEEYEPTIVAGRIVADTFITYFERGGLTYKLKEKYGVDEKGGYITYSMERLNDQQWIEAKLTDIEETKDYKDQHFPGIMKRFSLYKPNKLPNSEFRGSRLGESDYSGSHGMFDAIDEVISAMVQEFRDAKIKNFWPSNLLPTDPTTNMQYLPPTLKKDFITLTVGIGEKEKPTKPEQIQGLIHTEKYISSYTKLIEGVLNNAGLSPQSIGVTGLESTAASEESQELREKTSIRTREKKIGMWEETLSKLFELLLILDDIKNGNKTKEYYITTHFNDYKIKTMKDKTNEATAGLTGKAWDIKKAVDYVHDDMTDDERLEMRINIKIENGINTFTKEEELFYKKMVQEIVEETPLADVVPEENIENENGVDIEENANEPQAEDQDEQVSGEKENVDDVLLNGAQITSAVSIIASFNNGILSFEGALEMLKTFLNIPEEKARVMLNNGIKAKEDQDEVIEE